MARMAVDGIKVDAVAGSWKNPVNKHQPIRFSLSVENKRADAGRDGRTLLARQILRREWGQGNAHFLCSAGHEQDWQPYPVDLIHTLL